VSPRFRIGDVVQTRPPGHEGRGHIRLPRYLSDRRGTIEAAHGPRPLADHRALGSSDSVSEELYTVVFEGSEVGKPTLGGEASFRVSADLWESYLEPMSAPKGSRPR